MARTLALLLVAWLPLAACTYASGNSRILVSSEPAGAAIAVDGEPTGEHTPKMLDLGGFFGSDHEITLTLDGHEPETRQVRHRRTGYTSRWIDGVDEVVFPLPLHWTLGDWFTPFAVHWEYSPSMVHVRMYPSGEAPVRGPDNPGPALLDEPDPVIRTDG